ncbi:MAG: phospholipase D-like domain-containing protein [Enterobacteriaceae bacterium]
MFYRIALLLLTLCLFRPISAQAFHGQLPAGTTFMVQFSPYGKPLDVIEQAIAASTASVTVAAFWLTNQQIGRQLLQAAQRGVSVQIVADYQSAQQSPHLLTCLATQGVSVRLNKRYPLHHHKFMVLDDVHLQLGSLNYTQRAVSENAENILLLRDVPTLAGIYRQEWERLWREAEPVKFSARKKPDCRYLTS